MVDFTKCQDSKCHRRQKCLRYRMEAGPMQSFFSKSPRVGTACEYFMRLPVGWTGRRMP